MDTTQKLLHALDPKYILKQEQLPSIRKKNDSRIKAAIKESIKSTQKVLKSPMKTLRRGQGKRQLFNSKKTLRRGEGKRQLLNPTN